MITDTTIVPPGGWTYHQPETDFTMTDLSLEGLRVQIKNHRLGNQLDLDPDWWERVQEEMCASNAKFAERYCDPNAVTATGSRPFIAEDLFKFFKSMRAWAKNGFTPVAPEVAEARREICRACPQNIDVKGCTPCRGALRWLGVFMSKEEANNENDGLRNCGVCRCVLRLKVLLPDDAIAANVTPSEDYPANCWVPKLGTDTNTAESGAPVQSR